MTFLVDWVIQLITLIFIIMIVEMLIPQTTMKKYVNTVLSLVFLLLFLQPIFQLFKLDVDQAVGESLRQFEERINHTQLESEIELKKKDIQATQSAYVIEELAIQLENQVEGELKETYGVEISDINFSYKSESYQVLAELDTIEVYLIMTEESQGIIEEVVIGRDLNQTQDNVDQTEIMMEVKSFLYQAWDLETEMLAVFWEEGI